MILYLPIVGIINNWYHHVFLIRAIPPVHLLRRPTETIGINITARLLWCIQKINVSVINYAFLQDGFLNHEIFVDLRLGIIIILNHEKILGAVGNESKAVTKAHPIG